MAYLEFDPQETLFHYSSMSGFEGVLHSKSLWLSDLSTTNDPREIEFGRNIILKAMSRVRDEHFFGSRGFPISILALKIVGYFERHRIFSCSTTFQGDSLPMWREYADNGTGVSIGFRPRAIKDMPLRVSKIRYLNADSSDAYVDFLYDLLEPHLAPSEFPDQRLMASLGGEIGAQMASIKHTSWDYEGEIRLSHATHPDNVRTEINGVAIPSFEYPDGREYFSNVQIRGGVSGTQVNYIPMQFGKYNQGNHDATRAIERVVLGPKNLHEVDEVEFKLFEAGFRNFEVSKSECALR